MNLYHTILVIIVFYIYFFIITLLSARTIDRQTFVLSPVSPSARTARPLDRWQQFSSSGLFYPLDRQTFVLSSGSQTARHLAIVSIVWSLLSIRPLDRPCCFQIAPGMIDQQIQRKICFSRQNHQTARNLVHLIRLVPSPSMVYLLEPLDRQTSDSSSSANHVFPLDLLDRQMYLTLFLAPGLIYPLDCQTIRPFRLVIGSYMIFPLDRWNRQIARPRIRLLAPYMLVPLEPLDIGCRLQRLICSSAQA